MVIHMWQFHLICCYTAINEQQRSAEFQILVFGHVMLRYIPEDWNP